MSGYISAFKNLRLEMRCAIKMGWTERKTLHFIINLYTFHFYFISENLYVSLQPGPDEYSGQRCVSIRHVVARFTGIIVEKSIRDDRHLVSGQQLRYYL